MLEWSSIADMPVGNCVHLFWILVVTLSSFCCIVVFFGRILDLEPNTESSALHCFKTCNKLTVILLVQKPRGSFRRCLCWRSVCGLIIQLNEGHTTSNLFHIQLMQTESAACPLSRRPGDVSGSVSLRFTVCTSTYVSAGAEETMFD